MCLLVRSYEQFVLALNVNLFVSFRNYFGPMDSFTCSVCIFVCLINVNYFGPIDSLSFFCWLGKNPDCFSDGLSKS